MTKEPKKYYIRINGTTDYVTDIAEERGVNTYVLKPESGEMIVVPKEQAYEIAKSMGFEPEQVKLELWVYDPDDYSEES